MTPKNPTRTEELRHLLGPGGPVADALTHRGSTHESRPEQMAVAEAVAAALSSERHLVVEAGTGVGKSFAYLVPLLRWAARRDKTVAVATSTIALQEQLVRSDLPLLEAALPFEVTFTLVKGRANYLCLRRLGMALEESAWLFDDLGPRQELEQIREWAKTTGEGSRQDLPFRPGAGVWDVVRAEQGNCKGRACPHFGRCHYQRSRMRAHQVRCLVLNHHVLMADLALRQQGVSFLPKIDALVIDEAHDLEDTAAEHLGLKVGSLGLMMLLGRLWQPRTGKGILAQDGFDRLRRHVESLRRTALSFFDQVGVWLDERKDGGGLANLGDGFPVEDTLSLPLLDLASAVEIAGKASGNEDHVMELTARAMQLEGVAETLQGIVTPRRGEVRWAERGYREAVMLNSAPIEVGPLLDDVLWQEFSSVVLTSATLATGRPASFDFLRGRLGLEEPQELGVGSPFDFERQAKIVIRKDMPDPVSDGARYEEALAPAVLDAVRATRGGAFVLFTGYGAMRRTVERIREDLEADGLEVLVQGEGLERPALIARFREGDAVLFGVASFWQGVDVPGQALRHVVIARLPFEVPTHPLQQARSQRVEAGGHSAFQALSLPLAAIRLKQGFGRLIRRKSDEGRVTILDPRIVTRRYGRYLLESLPTCPIEVVEAE